MTVSGPSPFRRQDLSNRPSRKRQKKIRRSNPSQGHNSLRPKSTGESRRRRAFPAKNARVQGSTDTQIAVDAGGKKLYIVQPNGHAFQLGRRTRPNRGRAFLTTSEYVQSVVDKYLVGSPDRPLKVLNCGCGYVRPIPLGGKVEWFGLDISAEQLARNQYLDHKLLGDIQTFADFAEEFDLVISIDVLEHLDRPRDAVANMVRAATAGGLLILKLPNVLSVKGMITKLTPLRFHEFVYRHVYRMRPDQRPFRTYHRLSNRSGALRKQLQTLGCELLEVRLFTVRSDRWAHRLNYWISRMTHWLTLGRLGHSELIIAARKNGPAAAQS